MFTIIKLVQSCSSYQGPYMDPLHLKSKHKNSEGKADLQLEVIKK